MNLKHIIRSALIIRLITSLKKNVKPQIISKCGFKKKMANFFLLNGFGENYFWKLFWAVPNLRNAEKFDYLSQNTTSDNMYRTETKNIIKCTHPELKQPLPNLITATRSAK